MKASYYRDRSTRLFRASLIFGNAFFCLLSVVMIAVGIFLISSKMQYAGVVYGSQILSVSCYLIIAMACLLFLLSFVGCFGAIIENKKLLLVYAIILSIIFMLGIIASTLAIVFQVWVYNVLKVYMKESLLNSYGVKMDDPWYNFVTRSWDEIQQNLECCALDNNGWMLYRQTFWYRDLPGLEGDKKPFVPWSCCVRDSSGNYLDLRKCQYELYGPPAIPPALVPRGVFNKALITKGCFVAGRSAFYKMSTYFIVIGFVVAFLVVIAITFAFQLYTTY